MKSSCLIFPALLFLFGCFNETSNSPVESPEELEIRLSLEKQLQNPVLKGFMIGSKHSYLKTKYLRFEHETVGSLPGVISVTFGDDKKVKSITFEHSYVDYNDRMMEFEEFAELINQKYGLRWNTDTTLIFKYESVKNNTVFSLDEDIEKFMCVTEIERRVLQRKLNRYIKEKRKHPLYEHDLQDIEEKKLEYQRRITDYETRYVFSISDKAYIENIQRQKELYQKRTDENKQAKEEQEKRNEEQRLLDDF